MNVDYLIIGQGLAGTLLAYELSLAGKSFFVIDNDQQQKSSDVAAGIVNPVVFRRLTKSWLIDDLFPHLLETYSALEKLLGVKLFYPLQIKKILAEGDAEFWQKMYTENKLQAYINKPIDYGKNAFINSDLGMGVVSQSGRVDLKRLIEKMKDYLLEKQNILFENFNFNQLFLDDGKVKYQTIEADKIIFCEGYAVSQNPYFKDIRFKHTKGEVLRVKTEKYNSQFILNKAIFLMPEDKQYYRLGATYDWNDLSTQTTRQARKELQKKLSQIFTGQYRVVEHQSGIRPTTHDRRPVIGLHPKHKQIGIFNGLGSKGTMIGPYFARQLTDYLCGKIPRLHPEVSIDRYFRH